jgi:hypothetical protein
MVVSLAVNNKEDLLDIIISGASIVPGMLFACAAVG